MRDSKVLNFIAGGLAGAVASSLTNPIEMVKTQLQSSYTGKGANFFSAAGDIYRKEGVSGFYRGLGPTLVGIVPARSSYFWAYAATKAVLGLKLGSESPVVHFVSAVAAGFVTSTLTNPLWMVRTRIQLLGESGSMYAGWSDAFRDIIKNEGWKGLMKGVVPSYWGISEGAIYWMLYEKLKKRLADEENGVVEEIPNDWTAPIRRAERALPKPVRMFAVSGLCKAVASSFAYPHEVCRVRLRQGAVNGVFKYTGMLQTLQLVAKEEGIAGLYRGLPAHLVRVVPNNIILFYTYETLARILDETAKGVITQARRQRERRERRIAEREQRAAEEAEQREGKKWRRRKRTSASLLFPVHDSRSSLGGGGNRGESWSSRVRLGRRRERGVHLISQS
uniref:Mitochondrial carrier protein n=1 Tax=Chromera velia CCMP2878 TaxID=1169474 RepID=A0A0G4HJ93_9ALVE|eukprot:Cvel_28045.t1-p1 / transcript=Cvel_28045.t1 / gene=Cvel_28045 / organism=Chromera_velia_CCMP2878 / gene_product=Mitochondrial carrier protein RIM2, putative / transcript_product=Mitochondrial carrier protein RIM2, putative / location=Cvel_scaffold3602:7281-9218(+) / protein_length=391 / sequence_SO=supercontig / SO=protein_coding / is_pseudo=false